MNDIPQPIPSSVASTTTTAEPEAWVERHADYLFNYAVGQVRDVTLAEDLVQDTLLAALRAQERFAGQSSERTWLTGILRHKILDHLRSKRRRPTASFTSLSHTGPDGLGDDTMLWLHEVADECASPSRRLELAELRAALVQAMGTLPPRIAQVFELHAIRELPTEAVCAAMKISPNNLWVMLHRARRQLREVLAPAWNPALG